MAGADASRAPLSPPPPPTSPPECGTVPLADRLTSSLSLQASPEPEERTPLSVMECLPPELIEAIGHAVCRLNPVGPPTEIRSLLLLSRRFYEVLGPSNAGFYANLFKERFDYRSAERRWAQMYHIEQRREKRDLLESLPEVKPDVGLQLDPDVSFTRPASPSAEVLESKSPWRPLTNRDYATEFKRRCTVLTRMRIAAESGQIPPSSSRPSSPRLQAFTPQAGKAKLQEPDELTQNLWTCFLMLLENDGKNMPHLVEYARLHTYMRLFYDHSLLPEALKPGWPRQTAGRALGLWISWLGGDDLSTETPLESDQRFFVLKPYVFAAHKFDAFPAPWTIPSLPVSHEEYPIRPPPEGPFFAELRPRSNAQLITHMGRRVEMAPPNLAQAAIFSFFHRVEQDPAAQSDLLTHAQGTPAQHMLGSQLTGTGPGGLTPASRPTKTPLPQLVSPQHDRDFIRAASCIDPYSSLGLPKLYMRGSLTGSWEGRFSFFDFDSYRDMLGGRMRSLYEGPFGDQPQVWKLEERIVRLERDQRPGGKGSPLNAGFQPGETVDGFQPRTSRAHGHATPSAPNSAASSSSSGSNHPGLERSTSRRRTSVDLDLDANSSGRAAKRAKSWSDVDAALRESDEEDWTDVDADGDYEILLTGTGHSAWGQFVLKGRVRAWDGMFSIIKEYTPDTRGRWVYRGMLVGGNLVGRWRDTHTPTDMNGYEGTWLMTRRS
ncbi:hypothetical protein JCM8202_006101 [Rhodotorula sphaerocarpa]